MKVKFTLPVGALIHGWRHLGDGEFIAPAVPTIPTNLPPPLVVEFLCLSEDSELPRMQIEQIDDPMDVQDCYRRVSFSEIIVAEPTTNVEPAPWPPKKDERLAGIPNEELHNAYDLLRYELPATSAKFDVDGVSIQLFASEIETELEARGDGPVPF